MDTGPVVVDIDHKQCHARMGLADHLQAVHYQGSYCMLVVDYSVVELYQAADGWQLVVVCYSAVRQQAGSGSSKNCLNDDILAGLYK